MYYVNSSGKDVTFYYKGEKFIILAWSHVDLPEELYEYIESNPINIPLEVDYHRYIAEK